MLKAGIYCCITTISITDDLDMETLDYTYAETISLEVDMSRSEFTRIITKRAVEAAREKNEDLEFEENSFSIHFQSIEPD